MALWRALGDPAWTALVTSRSASRTISREIPSKQSRYLEASRELHSALGDRHALGLHRQPKAGTLPSMLAMLIVPWRFTPMR